MPEIPGPSEADVVNRTAAEPVSGAAAVSAPDSATTGETPDVVGAPAPSDAEQTILKQIAETQARIDRLQAERDSLSPGDAKIPSLSKMIAQEAKALARVKRESEMEEVALTHAPGRAEKKAIKEEEDRDKIFRQVGMLIDGDKRLHDHMQRHRTERVEKHYGKGWLGKINAMLAGANIEGGPNANQDIVLRIQKTLIKEVGIKGTISLVAAGLLAGTVTAPMLAVIGTAIAAGIAGRAAVEGIRVWRGKERGKKAEIDKMDGAVEEGIQTLIDQCSGLRLQLRDENESSDPSYDVESDPRYLEKFLQIVELLEDDSQRRVALISSTAENTEGKHADRYVLVGANGKELGSENQTVYTDVKNVGEEYKKMRESEKKTESTADFIAGVTSFTGAIWAKFGLAKHVAEQAAKATADAVAEKLKSGATIGPYDFDKIRPDHFVKAIADDAKAFLGSDNIWRDTVANLRGAIESQELVKLVASEAKALIGVGISSLVQIFHRPIVDSISRPEERIAESDQKNMTKLREGFAHDFPSKPVGAVVPRPEIHRPGSGGGGVSGGERAGTVELDRLDHLFTNVDVVHGVDPGSYFEEVYEIDVDDYDPQMRYFYPLDGRGDRTGGEPFVYDKALAERVFEEAEVPKDRPEDSLRVEGEDEPIFQVGQEIDFSLKDKDGTGNPAKAKITEIEDPNDSTAELNLDDQIRVTFKLMGKNEQRSLTLTRKQWTTVPEGAVAWELILNRAFEKVEAPADEDDGDTEDQTVTPDVRLDAQKESEIQSAVMEFIKKIDGGELEINREGMLADQELQTEFDKLEEYLHNIGIELDNPITNQEHSVQHEPEVIRFQHVRKNANKIEIFFDAIIRPSGQLIQEGFEQRGFFFSGDSKYNFNKHSKQTFITAVSRVKEEVRIRLTDGSDYLVESADENGCLLKETGDIITYESLLKNGISIRAGETLLGSDWYSKQIATLTEPATDDSAALPEANLPKSETGLTPEEEARSEEVIAKARVLAAMIPMEVLVSDGSDFSGISQEWWDCYDEIGQLCVTNDIIRLGDFSEIDALAVDSHVRLSVEINNATPVTKTPRGDLVLMIKYHIEEITETTETTESKAPNDSESEAGSEETAGSIEKQIDLLKKELEKPAPKIQVIGDIHGDLSKLNEIIDDTADKVIFTGDFIDRGPNSKGVLERVKQLVDTGKAEFVLGNHDLFFLASMDGDLDALENWALPAHGGRTNGGDIFLREYGIDTRKYHSAWTQDGIKALSALSEEMRGNAELQSVAAWLRERGNMYLVQDGDLMMHAAPTDGKETISFARAINFQGNKNRTFAGRDKWNDDVSWARGLDDAMDSMSREESQEILDNLSSQLGVKVDRVVFGHSPSKQGLVQKTPDGRMINIDAGMTDNYGGYGGSLYVDSEGVRFVARDQNQDSDKNSVIEQRKRTVADTDRGREILKEIEQLEARRTEIENTPRQEPPVEDIDSAPSTSLDEDTQQRKEVLVNIAAGVRQKADQKQAEVASQTINSPQAPETQPASIATQTVDAPETENVISIPERIMADYDRTPRTDKDGFVQLLDEIKPGEPRHDLFRDQSGRIVIISGREASGNYLTNPVVDGQIGVPSPVSRAEIEAGMTEWFVPTAEAKARWGQEDNRDLFKNPEAGTEKPKDLEANTESGTYTFNFPDGTKLEVGFSENNKPIKLKNATNDTTYGAVLTGISPAVSSDDNINTEKEITIHYPSLSHEYDSTIKASLGSLREMLNAPDNFK